MVSSECPMVSIGVPTYNGAHRIMKALNSVFKQNYPNLELIIADNCSTDDTEAVCKNLSEKHSWIRYIRQPQNVGVLANFRFTLTQATGKYFMWVSDDDLLEPGVLFKYVEFLENNPDYVLTSGRILYWDEDQYMFDEQFSLEQNNPKSRVVAYYSKVRWTGMEHGMMRRELAQQVPTRKVYGSDYHFMASVAFLGKMKSFEYPGYNKWLGGSSDQLKKYVRSMGEPEWAVYFPRFKIALDAMREPKLSSVYGGLSGLSKFTLGMKCALAVLYNYYPKLYSEVLIKKIRNLGSPGETPMAKGEPR